MVETQKTLKSESLQVLIWKILSGINRRLDTVGEKISKSEGRVTDALYRYVNGLNMSTKKQKFSDGTKNYTLSLRNSFKYKLKIKVKHRKIYTMLILTKGKLSQWVMTTQISISKGLAK